MAKRRTKAQMAQDELRAIDKSLDRIEQRIQVAKDTIDALNMQKSTLEEYREYLAKNPLLEQPGLDTDEPPVVDHALPA